MPGALPYLGPVEQRELLNDLNYLNLQEIRSFCDRHSIPYRILVATTDGRQKPTKDTMHLLVTGQIRIDDLGSAPRALLRRASVLGGAFEAEDFDFGRCGRDVRGPFTSPTLDQSQH